MQYKKGKEQAIMLEKAICALIKIDCILVYTTDGITRVDNTLDAELSIYNQMVERISPLVKGKKTRDLEKIATEDCIQQISVGILYSLCAEYDAKIAEYRQGNLRKLV